MQAATEALLIITQQVYLHIQVLQRLKLELILLVEPVLGFHQVILKLIQLNLRIFIGNILEDL